MEPVSEVSITSQLGIDWRMLLSQAVNFLLLLLILRQFVYRPILNILKKRQEKIEEGIAKSEEAGVRLKEVDEISKKRVRKAEEDAISLIKEGEQRAKALELELLAKTKAKEASEIEKAKANIAREKRGREELKEESIKLVKEVFIKTVELAPEKIDEALIKKAVDQIARK